MHVLYELVGKYNPDWTTIQELVRSDTSLMTSPIDENGHLLHYACWRKAPSDFVIKLINDYPIACEVKDDDGWLPLYYACRYHQSESVIQSLVNHYKEACEEKGTNGWLPLHIACANNQSDIVIQLLIHQYPKACVEKLNDGLIPLHIACDFNVSLSVIQLLVYQCPESLNATDNDKYTPLDCAKAPRGPGSIPNFETIEWLQNITPCTIWYTRYWYVEQVFRKNNLPILNDILLMRL